MEALRFRRVVSQMHLKRQHSQKATPNAKLMITCFLCVFFFGGQERVEVHLKRAKGDD